MKRRIFFQNEFLTIARRCSVFALRSSVQTDQLQGTAFPHRSKSVWGTSNSSTGKNNPAFNPMTVDIKSSRYPCTSVRNLNGWIRCVSWSEALSMTLKSRYKGQENIVTAWLTDNKDINIAALVRSSKESRGNEGDWKRKDIAFAATKIDSIISVLYAYQGVGRYVTQSNTYFDDNWIRVNVNCGLITYIANIRERAMRLAAGEKLSDPITSFTSFHFSMHNCVQCYRKLSRKQKLTR